MISSLLRTALVVAMAAATSAFATPTLSVAPSSGSVLLGDSFSIDVRIDGLGDGVPPSVGVFDLDLSFDPTLASFVDATFGAGLDVLGLGSLPEAKEPVPGALNLFELSLDSPDDLNALQPDGFLLARVTFSALAVGVANFNLTVNAIGDADGVSIPVDVLSPASVAITAVPEPQTLALLLGGFGLVGVAARRRSAVQLWR